MYNTNNWTAEIIQISLLFPKVIFFLFNNPIWDPFGCPITLVSSIVWWSLALSLTFVTLILWRVLMSYFENVLQFGFADVFSCQSHFFFSVSYFSLTNLTLATWYSLLLSALFLRPQVLFWHWYAEFTLLLPRIFPLRVFKYLALFICQVSLEMLTYKESLSFTPISNICLPHPHYSTLHWMFISFHKHYN